MNRIYTPCDDCAYGYSQQNQENNMCKICEFEVYKANSDIVKVVRCKDCKHENSTPKLRKLTGQYWCKHKLQPCNADDFCSYGEKNRKLEEPDENTSNN